ncbi:TniB family NTP-binding protein [Thioalkalivibrio sp. ALJ24]|uniref:TniB family NTP-binding protein n=1 Tax=Thioalkalivibrio sp. ALJ24 TaxID=545276 RepID=UPI0003A09E82|nr:TniB family NTP-binding protein [Thioalkalivibrio sp. ALJ24]
MGQLEHLSAEAQEALSLPPEDRLRHIRKIPRWIGYEGAHAALDRLEDLHNEPKTHRMPNMLLYGDSNNGKTVVVRRFQAQHPAFENPEGEGITVPVLVVEAPPKPDDKALLTSILHEISAPYRANDPASKLERQLLHYMRYVDVRMLIIDEIHNLIAGPTVKQKQFLNLLKHLGNQLQIPIVGVGTKEALRAIGTDPQLANRFHPFELPRWSLDKAFARLLVTFERSLPLVNPSTLGQKKVARKLHLMSEGLIGELAEVLRRAAIHAAKDGSERITLDTLNAIEWTPPSGRR